MILARTAQGYLLAISRAIKLFSDDQLIEPLTTATTAEAVIDIIRHAEARLKVPSA